MATQKTLLTDAATLESAEQQTELCAAPYSYVSDKGTRRASVWTRFWKRAFDFVSALLLFIVLNALLVFPVLMIVTAIKMHGNPFFTQPRPGKNGKIFKMIKFRTMNNLKDADGNLLPDEVRLTRYGKKLRDTSLDELPELLNIIGGQMSVVGPRPQLVRDMVFFGKDAMRRQSVRPGLTGLAQVRGRNNLSWEEKFDYDLDYVDRYGFVLDMKILFGTVKKVFRAEDVATDGMETAEDYGAYLLRTGKIDQAFFDSQQVHAQELLQHTKRGNGN